MPSKQNIAQINAWKAQDVDRIAVQPRKDQRIPEKLEMAVKMGKAPSKQAYILAAIDEAFKRDGIVLEGEER